MQLGAKIRGARERAGLTQQELADKIGVGRSAVGAYEVGRVRPFLEVLSRIASVLGVGLDALTGTEAKMAETDAVAIFEKKKKRII